MKILVVKLLAGLAITVAISIGPFTSALSADTKGRVKGDVSISTGSYARGYSECLNCIPSENNDGTGAYISHTVGKAIQTQTKVYEDGAMSVDAVLALKGCYGEVVLCGKVALKERVADNFDKKKYPVPYTWSNSNGLKSYGYVQDKSLITLRRATRSASHSWLHSMRRR